MRALRRHYKLKRAAGAAIILLAFCRPVIAAPPSSPKYVRIMSLKLCTDELLMDLAPPQRIASISYLSREKAALKLWPEAADIAVNHNTAEEVLSAHPDLVLTDEFTTPVMRAVLARSGARVVEVPVARNFDQIRKVTRLVADAIGARPRAEMLIAHMDDTLRRLAASAPRRTIRVAGWGGGGFVPGRDGLFNSVLFAAGGQSIAGGFYDVEGLIAVRPEVLAYGDDYSDTPSLRGDQNDHPVLLKLFGGRRITYPSALYGCGLPQSADAAVALRAALTGILRNPGGLP